jgi:hypothetical protein
MAAGEEVGFWALLGFAEMVLADDLAGRARWVERDGFQVHLLFCDAPVAPPRGHAAIVVADYDAVVARLRAAGHEAAPRQEYWGSPRTQVRSPAGHLVELMAAPPG